MKEIEVYKKDLENVADYGTNGFIATVTDKTMKVQYETIAPLSGWARDEGFFELIVTLDSEVNLKIDFLTMEFSASPSNISLSQKSGIYHFYFKLRKYDGGKHRYLIDFFLNANSGTYKISEVKLREWKSSEIFEKLQSIDNEGMQPKETALESKVSNISAKFDELSDFLKTFTENDMSHVNGENVEKIGELESLLQSYDERLSAMVGKYVRIAPECKNYFNASHEAKQFEENDVLKTAIYTVKAYQSGLYTLSSPQNPDILVSFEMVTRV